MTKEDINKLVEDYNKYLDSLEHAEDGDFTTFIWNYPEAAIEEYGKDLYEAITNSKQMKIYQKLLELEQDFN